MKKIASRRRLIVVILLSLLIVLITSVAMYWNIVLRGGNGPLGEFSKGVGALRTFTNESNILYAGTSLITAICACFALTRKEYAKVPQWLYVLQLITTTAVMLTFLIVVVFLAPIYGIQTGDFFRLFGGEMFATHFVTPILALILFAVLSTLPHKKLTIRDNLFALAPVIIYGIVYFINVMLLQIWPDFYQFTFGGKVHFAILVAIAILLITFAIARLLIFVSNKNIQK